MIARCENHRHRYYANYGGRGITVCDPWRGSFAAFLADVGPKPSAKHTLDRVDNERGYEPGNCRWATRVEQAQNKRTSRVLTIDGRTMSAPQWSPEVGLDRRTIQYRMRALGWPAERALRTPRYAARRSRPGALFAIGEEALTLKAWAERSGASEILIRARLRRGWTVERAVWEPLSHSGRHALRGPE
jgi:hypothetical protein